MIFNRKLSDALVREIIDHLDASSYKPSESLQPLYDKIADSRVVMLGEASHGTHEYYVWRSRITRYLVEEKGFNVVAVEGDWPDMYEINRYIRGYASSGKEATDVLQNFRRWPTWMWANWEIAALADWMKDHNQNKAFEEQVGFYGLDVYSLWESLEAVRNYLKENDPKALQAATQAMECFEPHDKEGANYGSFARFSPETCEDEVVSLLRQIRKRSPMYDSDPETPFSTEQNALIAVNAEKYYRAMMGGGANSWNIRDRHMMETLERLLDFHGSDAKAVVWEHNTHIGDARATDMAEDGLVNTGQLAREKYGNENVSLVGFGSYGGSVIAGDSWGAPMRKMPVPEARENSWEELLHKAKPEDKLILSDDLPREIFKRALDHRAIGVVYHPESERFGNYVPSVIPKRYDAFLYFDRTEALHPLGIKPYGDKVPETYPWKF